MLLRQMLKNNIERLRLAICCAIKYRRSTNENTSEEQNAFLKKDILNSIHHVFGNHEKCDTYFCNGSKDKEKNFIPELEQCGLYNDIVIHLNRLVNNSSSLLKNMTNNASENYNSVLAKFIGGKRVDFTRRGGYSLRCFAAGYSWNSQGEYLSKIHQPITHRSPGVHTKRFVDKRKAVLCRKRLLYDREKRNAKRSLDKATADADYGLDPHIMDTEISDELKQRYIHRLCKTIEEINQIEASTKEQSSCTLWHEERRIRLTASAFGRICKLRPQTDCLKVSRSILIGFRGNTSTRYGVDNEVIARRDMESILKEKIRPCGLYIHPTDNYLGASPDGIIGENTLLEIKCPYAARFVTPEEAINQKKVDFATIVNNKFKLKRNHSYFYQVQGQLYVSNKKSCFFVFWTPKGVLYEEISRDETFYKEKMHQKLKDFFFNFYLKELIKDDHKS